MADYDDRNTFVLFLETEKKHEKAPDYKGTYTTESGEKFKIAAWKRVSQSGTAFLSGKRDDYKPEDKETSHWEDARNKLKKPDAVIEELSDEPLDLSQIPF